MPATIAPTHPMLPPARSMPSWLRATASLGILSRVVAIAGGLLWSARHADKRSILA